MPFGRGGGSGGDANVRLGIEIDGLSDADRAIETLQKRIDALNAAAAGGGAPAGGSGYYGGGPGGGAASASAPLTPGGAPPLAPGFLAPPAPGVANNPLAPGALAPPAPGVAGGGGAAGVGAGGGGTTVIQAANVTLVQPGNVNVGGPGGGGAGGGGGLPPNYPLPGGWSPFGGGGGGGGPQPPGQWPGFVEAVYQRLEQLPSWQGAAGARFLGTNALGRQVFGGLAALEGFLPQGFMQGAAGFLGAAAAPLAGIGLVGGIVAGAMDINNRATLPEYYRRTQEMALAQAGRFYDPIQREADIARAQSEGNQGVYEAWRSNPVGWLGRIASFGIADAIWTGYIRPGFDRERALIDARRERRLGARELRYRTGIDLTGLAAGTYTDDDMPDGLRLLNERVGLAGGLGPFAPAQGGTILGFNFSDYSTPQAGVDTMAALSRLGLQRGFEDVGAAMLSGADPRRFFSRARSAGIFAGDIEGLFGMREEYVRGAGGDVRAGMASLVSDMRQLIALQASRTREQVAASALGMAQSQIGTLQVTGGGYREIALAQQNTGSLYAPMIAEVDRQIAAAQAAGNPLAVAQLQERKAQLLQGQAAAPYQAAMTLYQGRGVEADTSMTRAQTGVFRATYTGSEGDVIRAYGRQVGALGERARLLRDMAVSPFISPEQRAQYAAQAEEVEAQASIGMAREMGGYSLGLRQGEVGIRGARAGEALSQAELFGGREAVYRAQMGQAAVTQQQLRLTQMELAGAFGPRSEAERNELTQRQIELQRQLNESIETARRRFLDAGVAVAQFQQGVVRAESAMEINFFGAGGGRAGELQGGNVAAARRTLAAAQAKYDAVKGLPEDNPYRMQAQEELEQAKVGVQEGIQAYASMPFSVGLERERAAGQFTLSALSRTYAAFGDMRGTVTGLMGNVQARGRELQELQRQGLAEIDRDPSLTPQQREERRAVLLRDFEGRRYQLGNEAISLQQTLENGWMDRLISQTYNMPGRGSWVASQFTRREAAPFLQTMGSVFGFSGEGAEDARDNFLFRGPRIANTLVGNITRPQGFMETAMSGFMGPRTRGGGGSLAHGGGESHGGHGGQGEGSMPPTGNVFVSHGGRGNARETKIIVIVKDERGNVIGRGGTAGTLHDLQNAPSPTSRHADGVSRQ